jgi:hypothetical protein
MTRFQRNINEISGMLRLSDRGAKGGDWRSLCYLRHLGRYKH